MTSATASSAFMPTPHAAPRLSICIATLNRAAFIQETLDTILPQLTTETELVVLDGASSDGTQAILERACTVSQRVIYRREATNCGVDQDYDKAVAHASGDYCWLMTDDDLLVPGAIERVLQALHDDPDLVVANACIEDKMLSVVLKAAQIPLDGDREFPPGASEDLFRLAGSYLSFIGGVVVRRKCWLARERERYFGSLFIHFGVLFQAPALGRARVLAQPLIRIRYGNAMWTARAFEIWIVKWPRLVWSFTQFSAEARQHVCPLRPAARLRTLAWYRAIGAFGPAEYDRLSGGEWGDRWHPGAGFVSRVPQKALNAALAIVCSMGRHPEAAMKLYELGRAPQAPALTRWLARRFLFPGTER